MIWHDEERIKDGKLWHSADSLAWEQVDKMWSKIGDDPRNFRLGLSADGINPHSSLSSKYSCWPVILAIYNLPPWLCMKRKFTMLTLLISGPNQPGNDIDVYLQPLIDDLQILLERIQCYNACKKETFTLRGVLLWTVNDFPAYDNFSDHCVKGYKTCPICSEGTHAIRLTNYRKKSLYRSWTIFDNDHPYRKYRKSFNGEQELGSTPKPLSGKEIYEKVSQVITQF